jgi:hypothetical protein
VTHTLAVAVAKAPVGQETDHPGQLAPLRGELVAGSGRALLIRAGGNEANRLKAAEASAEDVGGDPVDRLDELGEAEGAREEGLDDP